MRNEAWSNPLYLRGRCSWINSLTITWWLVSSLQRTSQLVVKPIKWLRFLNPFRTHIWLVQDIKLPASLTRPCSEPKSGIIGTIQLAVSGIYQTTGICWACKTQKWSQDRFTAISHAESENSAASSIQSQLKESEHILSGCCNYFCSSACWGNYFPFFVVLFLCVSCACLLTKTRRCFTKCF